MALESKDLEAIRLLMREEIHTLDDKIDQRFDRVFNTLDALVLTDEKREEETLIRDEQLKRIDERVESLEHRVESLDEKVA
jgi:tetrahydrodipicolinate N-succinyltransferase